MSQLDLLESVAKVVPGIGTGGFSDAARGALVCADGAEALLVEAFTCLSGEHA